MPVRLVLVDDHQLFRSGLVSLLGRTADCVVVGEAHDARSAQVIAEESTPDVVVIDVGLPGENGIALTRELRRRDRNYRVLVLTGFVSGEFATQAFAAGALGYAAKHEPFETLLEAIKLVARGERYVTPLLSSSLARTALNTTDERSPLAPLSAREREVFDMLVRGLANDAIAKHLFISVKTVETASYAHLAQARAALTVGAGSLRGAPWPVARQRRGGPAVRRTHLVPRR